MHIHKVLCCDLRWLLLMKVPAFVEGLFRIIDLKKTGCFFFAVDVEDETNEKKQKIQYS